MPRYATPTDRTPGRAAAEFSTIKTTKYSDQSNFVPFVVETGGWINDVGLDFFDKVSGALEGDSSQVRARKQHCVGPASAALVKQQGYLLAQIVKEIHAPDCLAVGESGCGWGWCGGLVATGGDDDDDDMFGSVHRSADDVLIVSSGFFSPGILTVHAYFWLSRPASRLECTGFHALEQRCPSFLTTTTTAMTTTTTS